MAIFRNIVKSILPPEDTAEMWLDGEGKLRAYTLGVWKEVSATEVNSEEVIKASQGYPYNLQLINLPITSIKEEAFEGDLKILYDLSNADAANMRLFGAGSFLANHVQKINIMGYDVEDMASLPSILTMIKDTYKNRNKTSVIFTLDTDTIEGDVFGLSRRGYNDAPIPKNISVNCKVKSLDCSHIRVNNNILIVSLLNSPTEILEQGSIKGSFSMFILPLALKNLEENAFARYTTEDGVETDCGAYYLFMPSLTVPESLPQSLSLTQGSTDRPMVYFPELIGERTYTDYFTDVFNIDAKSERIGFCFDILTGERVKFVGY